MLRGDLELAERLGISLKRLYGWEPRTVYEYDDEGRMVSSQPETEWDATERAWMLALQEYRRSVLCPCGCGFTAEVSQAEENENLFEVPHPTRCHARTAIDRAQEEYAKSEGARPQGLLWGARLKQQP